MGIIFQILWVNTKEDKKILKRIIVGFMVRIFLVL